MWCGVLYGCEEEGEGVEACEDWEPVAIADEEGGHWVGGELDDAKIDAVLVGGQGAFEATFWSDGAGGAGVGASDER